MGEQVAARFPWGYSSVGRAPALQAGGQGFESLYLHSTSFSRQQQKSGGVAQLGEHLPCKQGVSGSIPLVSTNFLNLENHIEETNSLL